MRYLDEIAYARFFRANDEDNKQVAKDLGMLKR